MVNLSDEYTIDFEKTEKHVPRSYQLEALDRALKQNSILCLPTGSGKTFIAIMILKNFQEQMKATYEEGGKRAFFLVPTKVLVTQQAAAIRADSTFTVGRFSGESYDDSNVHIDRWSKFYWAKLFNMFQVLVMTPKIFLDLIQIGHIEPKSISAIIFDEVHKGGPNKKGKINNDNYVDIMNTLKQKGHDNIKIVGLTASLINCAWFTSDKMGEMIKKVEFVYDSQVFFPKCTHGTNPKEIMWLYKDAKLESSEFSLGSLLKKISMVIRNLRQNNKSLDLTIDDADETETDNILRIMGGSALPITFSQMNSSFSELFRVYCGMGPWALHESLCFTLDNFLKVFELIVHQDNNYTKILNLIVKMLQDLKNVVREKLSKYSDEDAVLTGIPNKMLRILPILYEFYQKSLLKDNLSAIIFVQRRLDAFVLSRWLNAIAARSASYSFIKAGYTVGSSSLTAFPYNISHRNPKEQQRIIKDFREKRLNVLVATSVLEEGLDIPHCNLIIRYDDTRTFRAYVQCKGRARKQGAYYVFFAEESAKIEAEKTLKRFRSTEVNLPYFKDTSSQLNSSSLLEKTDFLTSPTGSILTLSSVISRVHLYCSRLPSDLYTNVMPKVEMEKVINPVSPNEPFYRCKLKLPKISPLHKLTFEGKKCLNEDEAKRHSYFMAAQELWACEELDDNFLPLSKEVFIKKLIQSYDLNVDYSEIENWKKECYELLDKISNEKTSKEKRQIELLPKPGTRRKYRHYPVTYSKILSTTSSMAYASASLYRVVLKDELNSSTNLYSLGLLTFQPLPVYELKNRVNIYSSSGPSSVNIELVDSRYQLTHQKMEKLFNFHKNIIERYLKIGQHDGEINTMFDVENSPYKMLFNFVSIDGSINYQEMEMAQEKSAINPDKYNLLEGSVISKNYGPSQRALYFVKKVCSNLSPKSPFPDNSLEYSSFEDYFLKKYPEIESLNPDQPMLECFETPKIVYSPFLFTIKMVKKTKKALQMYLPPQLCESQFAKNRHFDMISPIPAIVFQLNRVLKACELRKQLCQEIGYGMAEVLSSVDTKWIPQRFTNFEPVEANITYTPSSHSIDLSFINCTPLHLSQSNSSEDDSDEDSDTEISETGYQLPVTSISEDNSSSSTSNSTAKPIVPIIESSTSSFNVDVYPPENSRIFSSSDPPKVQPIYWDDFNIEDSQRINCEEFEKIFQGYLSNLSFTPAIITNATGNENKGDQMEIDSPSSGLINQPILIYRTCHNIYPYGVSPDLLLMATTTKKCDPINNLERLEIIGDSFLKVAITVFLYLKFPDLSEAHLTPLKGSLISNFHLLNLARAKGLNNFISDVTFLPNKNWLPPFYSSNNQEFTELNISDKSLADMVESLIGAHLISIGEEATLSFLKWIGFPICFNNTLPGSWLPFLDEAIPFENPEETEKEYSRYCLSGFERDILGYEFRRKDLLVEALTHPTWSRSQFNSYQRLEFVGDAVLDYLVTCYIFDHPKYVDLKPGDVTYIRQALVNNDYFATMALINNFHKYMFHLSPPLYSAIAEFRQKLQDSELLGSGRIKLGSFLLDSLDIDSMIQAPKALGDVFESIAGAIYLDSGYSLSTVWQVYSRFFGNELEFFCANVPRSPLNRLYETFPGAKFKKTNAKSNGKKPLNLIVNGWSFMVDPSKNGEEMTRKTEKLTLALCALNKFKLSNRPS